MPPLDNRLSVVVPAYREAANLRPLCERLFSAMRGANIDAELIIVDDDSRDGSEAIVAELAERFPVRIVVRVGTRGLSSAVLAGFAAARYRCLLVMDADLQHPPEQAPAVARAVLEGLADISIGSRYIQCGRRAEDWPWHRRLNSLVATWLARPLTGVADCMAGFFAVNRTVLADGPPLNPVGYKILLELLTKARGARVIEVPIDFSERHAGTSKLNAREQLLYLRHLARLYRFRFRRVFWTVLAVAGAAIVLALIVW